MATLRNTHPLFSELEGQQGLVIARETRDGASWLVVEFPAYGTVTAAAADFDEV